MKIGDFVTKAGLKISTLRYYEREGLMPAPEKNSSGYRIYSDNDLKRLLFIKNAQEIGFTLHQINELLELKVDSTSRCSDVRQRTKEKIAEVDEKLVYLKSMRKALKRLENSCVGRGPISQCPILEELEGN